MKIKIKETVEQIKEIDVEMPYYFMYEIGDTSEMFIYGCIEENKCTSITEKLNCNDNSTLYDIEVEKYYSIENSNVQSLFDPKFKSSKIEFEQARKRMIDFIISSVN